MGRIVTRINLDAGEPIEVWTGTPGHGMVHLGRDRDDVFESLTTYEAERLAIAILAARARLIGWNQSTLDADVALDAIDVARAEGLTDDD